MRVILSAHTEGAPALQTPLCERAGGAGPEALWVSQGSSACMIESLARVLCVSPGTEAGRKFKGKYIFYAVQSKWISPLSRLFAPVSTGCLRRARLLWNLRSKGEQESDLWLPGTACPWLVGACSLLSQRSEHCRGTLRFTFRVRARLPQSQESAELLGCVRSTKCQKQHKLLRTLATNLALNGLLFFHVSLSSCPFCLQKPLPECLTDKTPRHTFGK